MSHAMGFLGRGRFYALAVLCGATLAAGLVLARSQFRRSEARPAD